MTRTVSSRARAVIGCTTALGLASIGLAALPAAAATEVPFISEIHYDNTGTDAGEAIEVQVALGTDLTGWQLYLYNGNGGAVYQPTRTFAGTVTAPAGDPSGDGVLVQTYPSNGIQNGSPDAVALVDPAGDVVEFLSYEGTVTAADGPAAGTTSTDIGVAQNGSEPLGASLQKVDGAWASYDVSTFGQVNDTVGGGGGGTDPEPDPELCDLPPSSAVGAVQGTGAATPLSGQQVTLRGTVTSDTPGLAGFTIQDAGDGDPESSDGIFVGAAGADVAVGDVVVVRGLAVEAFSQTRVNADGQVDVCSSGNPVPAAVTLPLPSTDAERERYEGMRVTIEDTLTVTGTFRLDEFGEVRLSVGGILIEPTEAVQPGADAVAYAAENRSREIIVDDGSGARLTEAEVPYLTVEDSVRVGDEVATLGDHVLGYDFSQWRLQPVTGDPDQVSFDDTNPRTPTAPEVGGDVTVAAYNVLNYFTTLTSENAQARGAATAAEFVQQEDKIVEGIRGLGADVVALQEIENGAQLGGDADQAVIALVEALNEAAGAEEWDYVPTPEYGRDNPDVIQNAIIFKPDSVTPVGESLSGGLDSAPDVWDNAREPVAQLFEADGDTFWVVSNHFKSKGAGGATGANLDQGDGQGAFNADRTLQATDLARFATEDLTPVDADVLLLGDFNAYGNEDPITVLEAAGYLDAADGLDVFSYNFDQRNGNLDHALLSPTAAAKLTGADIWAVNAQEPLAYEYSRLERLYAVNPYRASDHNPIVVGLDLEAPLGTEVSLGDILLTDAAGPDRRNPDSTDYDLLLSQVLRVLEEDPESPVGVLLDPTVALTAFLPNDAAFLATVNSLLPGRVTNEQAALRRLERAFTAEQIETILLGHVVVGQTLDSTDVLASDGASLTTAAGTTLTIDIRDDGSIAIIDDAVGNRDALLVLDAIDVNLGQVQIGHTVDRVLLP